MVTHEDIWEIPVHKIVQTKSAPIGGILSMRHENRNEMNFRFLSSTLFTSLMLFVLSISLASPAFAKINKIILAEGDSPLAPSFRPNQRVPLFNGRNVVHIHGRRLKFVKKATFPPRGSHGLIIAKIMKKTSKVVRLEIFVPQIVQIGAGIVTLHFLAPGITNTFRYRVFKRGTVTSITADQTTANLTTRIRVTFNGAFFSASNIWNPRLNSWGPTSGPTSPLFRNVSRVDQNARRAVFDVTPARCGRLTITPFNIASGLSPVRDLRSDPASVLRRRRGYLSPRRRNITRNIIVRAAAGQTCPAEYRRPIPGSCPRNSLRTTNSGQPACQCIANGSYITAANPQCP